VKVYLVVRRYRHELQDVICAYATRRLAEIRAATEREKRPGSDGYAIDVMPLDVVGGASRGEGRSD
jgi:hypothetical protein